MPNAFSSPAAGGVPYKHPRTAAPRPLSRQVDSWVNQSAQRLPSNEKRIPLPEAPDPAVSEPTQLPTPAPLGTTPNPGIGLDPSSTPDPMGGTAYRDPNAPITSASPEGAPQAAQGSPGNQVMAALRADFPDPQAAISQFAGLDPAGKAAMVQQWLANKPQFAGMQDQIMARIMARFGPRGSSSQSQVLPSAPIEGAEYNNG
jgi:hypothetical protein